MKILNIDNQNLNEKVTNKVCEYLKIDKPKQMSDKIEDRIKELCVIRLCKTIGITCSCNFRSDFFNFFSSLVGEAICEILNINLHTACDELRFVRYEQINLVEKVKSYLENESLEEAFLDAFELADKFKYLIK